MFSFDFFFGVSKRLSSQLLLFSHLEQNSTAKIEHSKEIDSTRDRTVDAFVNANNATNLTSTIEIRGLAAVGSDALDNFAYLIGRKTFKPRSYAAICVRNPIHRLEHRGHILQIGERQPNDILIRFQRGIVKLRAGIYPRYIFDFDDPQVNITHVAITANVRYFFCFCFLHQITYNFDSIIYL